MLALDKIELIVYDFDGVMTNNKVYLNQNGIEMVQVNRADGLAVSEIKKLGIQQIIISTETNYVVQKRAEKLAIHCLNCVEDKEKELKYYCSTKNIKLDKVIYVGNDINDKRAMECVGWPICPSDAHETIRKIADHVFNAKGGEGIIRELFEIIIKEKGA